MKAKRKSKAPPPPENQVAQFDRALQEEKDKIYTLRLYVTGSTPRSVHAIESIKALCEEHLKGRYVLDVVDIYQQPELAQTENILAAPTLIKRLPLPLRKLIGDMANKERLLVGLDLRPKGG